VAGDGNFWFDGLDTDLRTTNGCGGTISRTVRYWIGGTRQVEMDLRPLGSFPQVFYNFFSRGFDAPGSMLLLLLLLFFFFFRPGFGGDEYTFSKG
jgi:hypothetical protein